jgi:outer membrane protein OmpA-like peptidoglycan-associated protein
MKKKRFLFLVILVVGIKGTAYCQVSEAKKEMAMFNYSRAIVTLQKMLTRKNGPASLEGMLLLAECYRKQNLSIEAKTWYSRALASGAGDPIDYYNYAQTLRISGDYTMAKQYFLRYDSLVPGATEGRLYAGFCDSALVWQEWKPFYEIRNAGAVNSPESDFGAVFFNEGILFASDRAGRTEAFERYPWTGNGYLHIYCSRLVSSTDIFNLFNPAKPELGSFNSEYHDGPLSFNGCRQEVFITRTLLHSDKGRKDPGHIHTHLLKLFTSSLTDGKWSKPAPFFLNSDEYSVGHPALSGSGDTLVFASDKTGGYGGTDLYEIFRREGRWSEPLNLGAGINSPGNEMFPFLASNGDLYYSSDGLPGFGGLDIYISKRKKDQWTLPMNMGQPLNSSFDDFSISFSFQEKAGFFSSNRPGGKGSDDIYCFRTLPEIRPTLPTELFISGCVKDKITLAPIVKATVFILDHSLGKVFVTKTNRDGFFRIPVTSGINYTIKAAKESYLSDCVSLSTTISFGKEGLILRDLLLDSLELNKVFKVENIYYDFDSWNIRQDAEPSLDNLVKIMRENQVNVELGSFTDCRGSVEYNMTLSHRRAVSAVQYIISRGIDSTRIIANGYGKSQPINQCNCDKNLPCTESEYRANRRTVFKIIGWIKSPVMNKFSVEKFHEGEIIDISIFPETYFDICE